MFNSSKEGSMPDCELLPGSGSQYFSIKPHIWKSARKTKEVNLPNLTWEGQKIATMRRSEKA
jgi:hypothetical protein